MCGRFVRYSSAEALARRFDATPRGEWVQGSYNVAPTQGVVAVRRGGEGRRELVVLRWGLIPHWSSGPDNRYSMINARAESVAVKPAYRDAYRRRRCLVPADGFYEWQATRGRKQPYYIAAADGEPLGLAGVWEAWGGERGVVESCAIITTDANATVAPIHQRMPVVLVPEDYATWLDPEADAATLQGLLVPCDDAVLTAHPVSTRVNSPRNDDPACVDPVADGG